MQVTIQDDVAVNTVRISMHLKMNYADEAIECVIPGGAEEANKESNKEEK